MEILLNRLDVEADVAAARIYAAHLALPALGTELSGQSEALEKFVSAYQEFADTLTAYLTVLQTDLTNVNKAVSTLNQTDQKQGQDIAAMGGITSLLAGR